MNLHDARALVAQIFDLYDPTGLSDARWQAPYGVTLLGEGYFGAAFELPDGRVLKVGASVDGTSAWISAAAQHFAKNGKPMRHAPIVWAFGESAFLKKTDRLVHIHLSSGYDRIHTPHDGQWYSAPTKWIYGEPETVVGWWAIMEKVETAYSRDYDEDADMEYPALDWRIRDEVYAWKVRAGLDCEDDMHSKNWGYTKAGRVVVFDPFYGNVPTGMPETFSPMAPRAPAQAKRIPPHRLVQHAGPPWAAGHAAENCTHN